MGIYIFLGKKLLMASQIATLWSFGNWAMPNTETFSRLWPPLSLQRDIRCCLPFCVILQWASKGGSKPLLLHKDTVSALQLRYRILSWLCLFPIQPPLFHSSVGQEETKLPLPGSTTERRKSFLSSCFSMYLLQMSSATDSLPCCLHWNKLEEDIIPSFLWLTDVIPNITQIMS